ncbi:MAG: hypothetical protein ACFFKA_00640 [Candidatus Thorarchaeota archaeon]
MKRYVIQIEFNGKTKFIKKDCGGYMAGLKIFLIKGTCICPFCIRKIYNECKDVLDTIPSNVQEQYQSDLFFNAL